MRQQVKLTILCSLFALILLGCGPISNVNIERSGATIDVELEERQIERILRRSSLTVSDHDNAILETVSSVDFQDGRIVVEGTYTDDNGDTQIGSFDVELSATDGMLNVQVTNVESNNVDLDDIAKANRELATEFAREAENGDVEFLDVSVTDTMLVMSIRVNF